MNKHERWEKIAQLLLAHPEGLRQVDIARRTESNRSTINRDILEMTDLYPIYEIRDKFFTMDRSSFLNEVKLTLYELEAIHLSARLFFKLMRFPFPHASGALRKLAEAQKWVSTPLADRICDTAEEIDEFIYTIGGHRHSNYSKIIEKLVIAISEKRPAKITYFSLKNNENKTYRIAPVTLEPYADGRTVYLLAWILNEKNDFRTFKTERIQSLELEAVSPDLFETIPNKELLSRFKNAWGIWTNEKGPVPVRLRFDRSVATRVSETIWHHSQKITELSDGCIQWYAQIEEPREMYPWIRGWGPDVTIIEPKWLLTMHKEDLRLGIKNYENEERNKKITC